MHKAILKVIYIGLLNELVHVSTKNVAISGFKIQTSYILEYEMKL
jgi:hypothetical protein